MQDSAGPQFVISGFRSGTSPGDQGTGGYYWSSSAYTSATYAYSLGLLGTSSTVYPAYGSNELYGISLRCLAQNQTKNMKSLYASPPATPPENSNYSTTNIQPMIKCVSIQWGWCWVGDTIGAMTH